MRALPHYKVLIILAPTAETFTAYARNLLHSGHSRDAARIAADGIAAFPAAAPLHKMAGDCLAAADEPERALEHYRQAAALQPKSVEMLCAVALACEKAGKPAEAFSACEAALALSRRERTAAACRKRLLARAVQGKGFVLFFPANWTRDKDVWIDNRTGQSLEVDRKVRGDPEKAAKAVALNLMPSGAFEQKLTRQDRKAMAQWLKHQRKKHGTTPSPEAAAAALRPPGALVPVLTVEPITDAACPAALCHAALLAEQDGVQAPGIEVWVLAIGRSGRSATLALRGPVEEATARKLMTALLAGVLVTDK